MGGFYSYNTDIYICIDIGSCIYTNVDVGLIYIPTGAYIVLIDMNMIWYSFVHTRERETDTLVDYDTISKVTVSAKI